ncbi:hypothetical protein LOZ58_005569 [Ophidiomyces ophidiicola]|nr:hypothetical protein LOZ58_005569 [Ophidiomyces ophidiicola]
MASVFTYETDPPRVSSPWSTPGLCTPHLRKTSSGYLSTGSQDSNAPNSSDPSYLTYHGITKLDVEPQDGPTEYKLHLLLRPRRSFISLSTGSLISGSNHSKSGQDIPQLLQEHLESASAKAPLASSSQTRQHRLHQLTTQLLWRLQQSSPFHSSSSTSELILPVLPDATPTLNIPKTLAPLLPGLEESQGALYEIGVSDDGNFIGLAGDELEESLVNLQAMAASLGCRVEILRKVAVGFCKWAEPGTKDPQMATIEDKLWVAEALVRPDLRSDVTSSSTETHVLGKLTAGRRFHDLSDPPPQTQQLQVAILGASGSGKSSLLGILSTSALDNGRGRSRISLLKHRHEIASGVTSSVAQELIGYSAPEKSTAGEAPDVVNYASGNVSAWTDIHATAAGGRLVFLSDLPGSLRYSKSTLRGLLSWEPHYVLFCIPANPGTNTDRFGPAEIDAALVYLDLCLKLGLPIVLVVTKLETATLPVKHALAASVSAIKAAGRKPVLLFRPGESPMSDLDLQTISVLDREIIDNALNRDDDRLQDIVPIVLTSAVTGAGIGRLHALLRSLPFPTRPPSTSLDTIPRAISPAYETNHFAKLLDVNEVFEMPLFKVYSLSNETHHQNDRGIILCGRIRRGTISVGDCLVIGPFQPDSKHDTKSNDHLIGQRAKGTCSKSFPDNLTSLRLQRLQAHTSQSHPELCWQEVRVVSVRNLRQPVKCLHEQQVGTIGIDPIDPLSCLGRIRKGMVLGSSMASSRTSLPPYPSSPPYFHTGFTASFPAPDILFSQSSIAVGSTMVVYIRSIRAPAKVLAIDNAIEQQRRKSSGAEVELFSFDSPEEPDKLECTEQESISEVKITFVFLSSVEWVEVHSRVLAMPSTASLALSSMSSSPSRVSRGTHSPTGLVGTVIDVSHS